MGMMRERRAPGVEHGGDTDPGAEMLGVGGDGDLSVAALNRMP